MSDFEFREKYDANPYDTFSPRKRRAFMCEDKKALAEITKRLRRFGYSDFAGRFSLSVHADQGFQPLAVFVKSQKIEDSEKYKEYTNATVARILYISRNMKKKRHPQFQGDQLKHQKTFLPYKEILITGGMHFEYIFQIISPNGEYRKSRASPRMDQMIHVELSGLMPGISGSTKKGKPISRIIPNPRYYKDCITMPYQLTEFLQTPIRPSDLEHIPAHLPRNMEPKWY